MSKIFKNENKQKNELIGISDDNSLENAKLELINKHLNFCKANKIDYVKNNIKFTKIN